MAEMCTAVEAPTDKLVSSSCSSSSSDCESGTELGDTQMMDMVVLDRRKVVRKGGG